MSEYIAIIGAGNIGSRHLQALALIDRAIAVSVVDPNKEALALAKKRFEELPANPLVLSVDYLQNLDGLTKDVDVAIIATSADIRKRVIEELLSSRRVHFLILEKVAFQSIADFEDVMTLVKSANAKAWVNCSYRRMFPAYQQLRHHFHPDEQIFFNLYGAGWGLVCNSIHLLDLFSYFTGAEPIKLDGSGLDPVIRESKREGFIELTGTLRGTTDNGSAISLLDSSGTTAPYVIQMFSKNAHVLIFESERKALFSTKNDNWAWQEIPFEILYQSQLTHLAVQKILDTNDCALVSLEEAFSLHKPMLNIFNDHLNKVTGKVYEHCPIT